MSAGKPSGPRPGPSTAATTATGSLSAETTPALAAFAKWLLDDARVVEVWGLLGARLAQVTCTTVETQSLELDSGDWFLVRVAEGTPTTLTLPTTRLSGIVRFRRLVGKGPAVGPASSPLSSSETENTPQEENDATK